MAQEPVELLLEADHVEIGECVESEPRFCVPIFSSASLPANFRVIGLARAKKASSESCLRIRVSSWRS